MLTGKKIKGFSIVEILFATVIFFVLIVAIYAVMTVGRGAWFTGDVSAAMRREIINAFTIMDKELAITRPAEISLTAGTSSNTLTFKLPQDNDADGTILDSIGAVEWSDDITYTLNAANQITRSTVNTTTVLANNIVSLTFTRPLTPLNLLQIDMLANKTSVLGRVVKDSGQIRIKMRN